MNSATVITLIAIAVLTIADIAFILWRKKHGKGSCACGCASCAYKDSCHTKQ